MVRTAAPTTIPRRRLSQQERSAATREALIDATIESLMEIGYDRSTTGEISERAGLSRGAHLHHFQTRATLFAAAVDTLAQRALDDLARGVRRLPHDERRQAAALDMLWRLFNGQLFQVMLELSVHGRTDPQLRAELDPIEHMVGHETMPQWLRLAFAGDTDDRRLDDLISLIASSVRGLAVMKLLEPSRHINERWSACRAQLLKLLDQHTED
jgi:AcrR family transcriptional regulator